MPNKAPSSVAIIGAGALGTALAHALAAAGVQVVAVASKRAERAEVLASAIPGARAVSVADAARVAPIALLAVSDSAIEAACEALGAPDGVLVAHTSGSRNTSTLEAARLRGARVGGFHPLAAVVAVPPGQTPDAEYWASRFRGAAFAIEGDAGVQAELSDFARTLGGRPFPIAGSDKPLYHLGASMLAAFAAGLAQVAWDGMRAAGAPADIASAGVGHLLSTVAQNVAASRAPAEAQTGPVARGDAGGLRRQADAARGLSAEAQLLYWAHAEHNIHLARRSGRIAPETAEILLGVVRDREPLR